MKSPLWLLSPIALALMLSGCGGEAYTYPVSQGSLNTPGGGTGASYPAGNWTVTDRALVVAQARQQSPATQDSFNGYLPLASLGVGPVTRGYEFTTPGNSSLSFSVVALEEGNSGFVSIRLLHALPSFPASTGAESIIKEGMSLDGAGLSYGGGSWYTSVAAALACVSVARRLFVEAPVMLSLDKPLRQSINCILDESQ